MVQITDINQARSRITPYLRPTPLEAAPGLGGEVWLKLENTNKTHSFKARGALNALLALDADAKARGIVTASSGNHAQGVAFAASLLGLSAKILMPAHTPRRKVSGVKRFGAEAVLFGANYDETEAEARRLEQTEGRTFISAYNDPRVVSGAGTIGLEILDELPGVERVLVPTSGGGLLSGVALAIKANDPNIEVIGVCAESAPAMYNVFNKAARPQVWDTLAEALSGDIENGSITIPLTQQHVDKMVLVSESAIASGMRWMVYQQGWVVEGGGAVGIAALLAGAVKPDRRTVVVVSGGNVDEETLRRVLSD